MPVVIAHDASWKSWGWALCDPDGPIRSGVIPGLASKAWRWDGLAARLQGLDAELAELEATLPPDEPPIRVVVERAPPVYAGRGNQAATGLGMGQITGAILLWGTRPGRLAYPWEVTPGDWRAWWIDPGERKPRGRNAWKAWAVAKVERHGWDGHLGPYPWEGEDGGARGDLAEAILIGVGAARHHQDGPRGPDPRRSPEWRPIADGLAGPA